MKKVHLLIAVALVAVAMSSCSQDDKDNKMSSVSNGTDGQVRITLGFKPEKPTSRASSTAKPTTNWKDNVKDLMVLFVTNNGVVQDARNIDLANLDLTEQTLTLALTNIKANQQGSPYTVYVIANSQQKEDITPELSNNDSKLWKAEDCINLPISNLLMKLVQYSDDQKPKGDKEGSTIYKQPAEIFLGSGSLDLTDPLSAGETHELNVPLERAISLMRVRIKSGSPDNSNIDFSGTSASFRIRRARTSVDPTRTYTNGSKLDVLYTNTPFQTTEPTKGYGGGTIIKNTDYKFWQDIKMFPGGSPNVGDSKFDFVLIGHAPEGYQPAAPAGPLGKGGGDVLWAAAISQKIDPNQILEVNVTLNQVGVLIDPANPVIPEPAKYANCNVSVDLVEWGAIVSTDIPV